MDRLKRQIDFVLEVDRVKQIIRRSRITGGERYENDGEHMWHVALAAMVLAEYANAEVNIGRVVAMLLVHDLVEIDAGDAFLYDVDARAAKQDAERAAADRIYAILPDDQCDVLRGLWDEYEARETPEARFATAVDRLLPMLLNHATDGSTWREHGIRPDQVLGVNVPAIAAGSDALASLAERVVADSVERGFFDAAEPIRTEA